LAKLSIAGGMLLVVGGGVAWLITPLGWIAVVLGVVVLAYGPFAIAWGEYQKPDHKVEGRTFVIDLFRSVKHPPDQPPSVRAHRQRGSRKARALGSARGSPLYGGTCRGVGKDFPLSP